MERKVATIKDVFAGFIKQFRVPEIGKFLDELEDPMGGKDLEEMLLIIAKMKEKLQEKAEELGSKSRFSQGQLDDYMHNQDNFTRQEWDAITDFEEKIKQYKEDFALKSQGATIAEIIEQGRDKKRKKNKLERFENTGKKWIPMS